MPWWGRLDDVAFLKCLYSLDFLSYTDTRRHDAEGDIQHRVANHDWADDCFSDDRFELTTGPDETHEMKANRIRHSGFTAVVDEWSLTDSLGTA